MLPITERKTNAKRVIWPIGGRNGEKILALNLLLSVAQSCEVPTSNE